MLAEAKGETVYWNAWGGAENINAYIEWAGAEVEERYGVKLVHVKLDDTAGAVAKVVAEKAAGKDEGGSVDLIWINGENFASMKKQQLLFSPGWAEKLPNWRYVDIDEQADGRAPISPSPSMGWRAHGAWRSWCSSTTRPRPPRLDAEIGQGIARLGEEKSRPLHLSAAAGLHRLVVPETGAGELVADRSRPAEAGRRAVVREGDGAGVRVSRRAQPAAVARRREPIPQNYPAMKQLLADGEVDIIFAFNPSEASSAIAAGELPDTVRSFTFPGGTLANTHFVAIPYNAAAKAGALVVADFLISPEAQARKQDPEGMGRSDRARHRQIAGRRQGPLRRARPRHRHAEAG